MGFFLFFTLSLNTNTTYAAAFYDDGETAAQMVPE